MGTDASTREELRRAGDVLATYHRFDATPPIAELFEAVATPELAAEVACDQLAGWDLTTRHDDLCDALVALGATPIRTFTVMSTELGEPVGDDAPGLPGDLPQLELRGPEAGMPPREGLVTLMRAAYPAGHPDEERGSDDTIVDDFAAALSGRRMGVAMPQSAVAYHGDRPVGLVLINRVPGAAPTGGPWVTDICRLPERAYAGLGRFLLTRAMTALTASGEPTLSLAVTEGNPARRLYESVGFSAVATTTKLRLPE